MSKTLNLTPEYRDIVAPDYNVTENFIPHIVSKLGKYVGPIGENGYPEAFEFLETVYATNALIAGSFVLSCIYDDFKANDIDIYLKVPKSYIEFSNNDTDFTIINYMKKNRYIFAPSGFTEKKCEDPANKISIGDILKVKEFYNVKVPEYMDCNILDENYKRL